MSDAPSLPEFLDQLLSQLLADLDTALVPGGGARPAFEAAARNGRARAGALLTLARAAVIAHRSLVSGEPPEAADGDAEAALEALAAVIGGFDRAALTRHADRSTDLVAGAEPGSAAPALNLARAMVRLYAGLGQGDDALGARGLHELRALFLHVDAAACVAATMPAAEQPVRVVRPDHFHDAFMQLSDAIRKRGDAAGDTPVARLSPDGRLQAVIEDHDHPLAAALAAAAERVGEDEDLRTATALRLVALLRVIDLIRSGDLDGTEGLLDDLPRFVGLVTAAATTPLPEAGFDAEVLLRIAAYNARLMQPPSPPGGEPPPA